MSEFKRVFRLYWAWEDEKEERWLEQMASQGWHLVSGPLLYKFARGVPAQVRYRLDYPPQDQNLQEYLRLCSDAGWERAMEFSGWQYFRTASPTAPEIYTDKVSRIAKYRRLLSLSLLLSCTTMFPVYLSVINYSPGPLAHNILLWAVRCMCASLSAIWIYIVVRLWIHIQHLTRQQEREREGATGF